MSLSNRHHHSLIVILLQVNHSLNAPVDPQRSLQHQPPVHLASLHLHALAVVKLIVGLELALDLVARDHRARRALRHYWSGFLAEALVRLDARAMAEQLGSEERAIARDVAVGHLRMHA